MKRGYRLEQLDTQNSYSLTVDEVVSMFKRGELVRMYVVTADENGILREFSFVNQGRSSSC